MINDLRNLVQNNTIIILKNIYIIYIYIITFYNYDLERWGNGWEMIGYSH